MLDLEILTSTLRNQLLYGRGERKYSNPKVNIPKRKYSNPKVKIPKICLKTFSYFIITIIFGEVILEMKAL